MSDDVTEQIAVKLNAVIDALDGLAALKSAYELGTPRILFPGSKLNIRPTTLCDFEALLAALPELKCMCTCLGSNGQLADCLAKCGNSTTA